MGTHVGAKFEDAVRYAVVAHAAQVRKDTKIPYIAHLLAVSALVLEAGGTETQAIAALLHDVAEDCGGQPRLDDVRRRFGKNVARIVGACSDSLAENPDEKESWCERKKAYLEHLGGVPAEVLLVSLADKLHNATAILRDLRQSGPGMFSRFTIGKEQGAAAGRKATEWYYSELVNVFDTRSALLPAGGAALLDELQRTVDAIQKWVPVDGTETPE